MDEDDLDRPRGILTERDREYLVGAIDLDEYEDPTVAERQFRHRIRRRFRHAVRDLDLLRRYLSAIDQELLFAEMVDAADEDVAARSREALGLFAPNRILTPFEQGWVGAFELFYRGFGIERPQSAAALIEMAIEGARYEHALVHDEIVVDDVVRLNVERRNAWTKGQLQAARWPADLPTEPSSVRSMVAGAHQLGVLSSDERNRLMQRHVIEATDLLPRR